MEFPSSKVTGCHPKILLKTDSITCVYIFFTKQFQAYIYMYFEINPCQTCFSFISMFSIPAE